MNVSDFHKYIDKPELLNASTVAELQEVLKVYPYFQTAHFLYLKSLYNQNNFKFNQQLKLTSVHVNNRKKLLLYLKNRAKPVENKIPKEPVKADVKTEIKSGKATETKVLIPEDKGASEIVISEQKASQTEPSEQLAVSPVSITDKPLKNPQQEPEVRKNEPKKDTKTSKKSSFSTEIKKEKASAKPQLAKKETKNFKKDKPNDSKKLSPLEIIQNRISQIKRNENTDSAKKEKEEKKAETKTLSPLKETAKLEEQTPRISKENLVQKVSSVLVKLPEKQETRPKTQPQDNKETPILEKNEVEDDDIVNISEMIQIEAPTQYFVEAAEISEKEEQIQVKPDHEKKSFSDWLNKISTTKQEVKKPTKAKETKPIVKNNDNNSLIDSFLKSSKSKQIKASTEGDKPVDYLKDLDKENEQPSFITETLAEIYIGQGYYDRAIKSYRKLSLKYPKKNTYFASQIEKVKKLKINS